MPEMATPTFSVHLVAGVALASFFVAAGLLWWSGRGTRVHQRQVFVAPSEDTAPRPQVESQATALVVRTLAVRQVAPPSSTVLLHGVRFQLAHAQTGRLIWTYAREGAALGFVRDVVRLRSHRDAAQFELRMVDEGSRTTTLARGEQLVRLALEDRVL